MTTRNRRGSPHVQGHALKLGLFLIATAASQVQAQTNVTMYGTLDVSLGKQSGGAIVMGLGYNNWLEFKDQEDLGDGAGPRSSICKLAFIPGTGAQERHTTFLGPV